MQQRGASIHTRLGVHDLVEAGDAEAGRIAALAAVHEVAERKNYFQQLLELSASNEITRSFQHSYATQQASASLWGSS